MNGYIRTELKQPVVIENIITIILNIQRISHFREKRMISGKLCLQIKAIYTLRQATANFCSARGRCLSTGRWNFTISAAMEKRPPIPLL